MSPRARPHSFLKCRRARFDAAWFHVDSHNIVACVRVHVRNAVARDHALRKVAACVRVLVHNGVARAFPERF